MGLDMSNLFWDGPTESTRQRFRAARGLSGLPRRTSKTAHCGKVCRSTNATTGSTVIDIDLGQARSLRALALQKNHNLSQSGSWRVKFGTSAGASDVYSGSYQAAWFEL